MSQKTKDAIQALEEMRLPELQARYQEVIGEATRCPNRTYLIRKISEALVAADAAHDAASDSGSNEEEPALAGKQPAAEDASESRSPDAPLLVPDAAPSGEEEESGDGGTDSPSADDLTSRDDALPETVRGPSAPPPRPEAELEPAAPAPPGESQMPQEQAHPAVNSGRRRERPAATQRGRFSGMTIDELRAKYREVIGRETGSFDKGYIVWKLREAEKGRIPLGPRQLRHPDGEPLDIKTLPFRLDARTIELMDRAWREHGIRSRTEFLRQAAGRFLDDLGATEAARAFRRCSVEPQGHE